MIDDGEGPGGQFHIERNTRGRMAAEIGADLDFDDFTKPHVDVGGIAYLRFDY
ncbi:MAG: hypothetical protein VX293_12520 [Candidatus Latescibacterota bacterium]|nr:hypothetical protein [Candidatus Latescibacterota bacterium]